MGKRPGLMSETMLIIIALTVGSIGGSIVGWYILGKVSWPFIIAGYFFCAVVAVAFSYYRNKE